MLYVMAVHSFSLLHSIPHSIDAFPIFMDNWVARKQQNTETIIHAMKILIHMFAFYVYIHLGHTEK